MVAYIHTHNVVPEAPTTTLPTQVASVNIRSPAQSMDVMPAVAASETLNHMQTQPLDDFLDDRFLLQNDAFFGTTFDWFAWGNQEE